ncbi:MAG: isoleucine--tRNA ligase [Chloroflexi bacterium]|nr:isoleucine--tRNA ligase [Chloroflexota bacterium]
MYQPVPRDLDFPALEQRILRFWDETRAFDVLRDQLAGSEKRFSFIDGPITANNRMGVHHAWGRTYKDVFQRYKAMTGHNQRWQNGFDCQGLWVEVGVEKELGFGSKRDIEAYGIGEFVQRCKERVLKFARVQTEQSIRMGYWMDWSSSYYTMSDENNFTIWRMLKMCHERGWLYRGHDVMPWCPRCGTGISQHEIDTEGYKEVTHTSLYVRLPLLDRPNESLLVWTTTPWTLSANVAAAVHPDLSYVRAQKDGQAVILVEPMAAKLLGPGWEVVQRFRGAELVGLRYRGPYDEIEAQADARNLHRVIPWTDVSQEDGTGIVHIAPGCGEEDYGLGKEFELPAIAPLDELGVYGPGFGFLSGQFVGDVAQQVTEDLRAKGLLFRAALFTHRYPHCWRCDTELVFRLVDEWYVGMDELRHLMMEVTKQIRWIPEFGMDRELDWLRNMHDWMISKKRYWGLALPIWRCDACNTFDVIGSREELRARAVDGWQKFEGHSPHRPWVDQVKIACGTCGGTIDRIPDVGNPWLDAGIVAYSTLDYVHNREHWEKWFPADFITESFPGQYRNWFYAMLVMSTVLENRPPMKTVLGFATLRGEDGRPMHKSWGNDIEFNEAAGTVGADILRWVFSLQNPSANLNFGWNVAHETKKRLLTLWNSYSFFVQYARLEGWRTGPADPPVADRPEVDRWLLAELQRLIRQVTISLESFDTMNASRAIESFVEDLSNWYIRRSRARFWAPGGRADPAALATLHEALSTVARLLAPFMPFLAEELYQNLVRSIDPSAPVSVHHCEFPSPRPELDAEALAEQVAWVRQVASLGHAARKQAGIPVRRPLAAVRVSSPGSSVSATLLAELADELNVKAVESAADLREAVRQKVEPNPKLLGPKYGAEYPSIRRLLQAGEFKVGDDGRVQVGSWLLEPDEAAVTLEPAPGFAAAVDHGVLVVLDTRSTPELVTEGRARELVRVIQDARKAAGFDVADRIVVRYEAPDELGRAFQDLSEYVARETLAVDFARGSLEDAEGRDTKDVDGMPVTVAIRRTVAR